MGANITGRWKLKNRQEPQFIFLKKKSHLSLSILGAGETHFCAMLCIVTWEHVPQNTMGLIADYTWPAGTSAGLIRPLSSHHELLTKPAADFPHRLALLSLKKKKNLHSRNVTNMSGERAVHGGLTELVEIILPHTRPKLPCGWPRVCRGSSPF